MTRTLEPIDPDKLKALMRLKPSLADAAAFFDRDTRTIQRHIEQHFGVGFKEFRETHMVHTRLALVRKAIQMGEAGNVAMLIFCLKNLCDWKDKKDPVDVARDEGDTSPTVVVTEEQLKSLVRAARGMKVVGPA